LDNINDIIENKVNDVCDNKTTQIMDTLLTVQDEKISNSLTNTEKLI